MRAELCFFFRVIQNIIELKPKSKYILAVDDSKKTLEDIVKVMLLLHRKLSICCKTRSGDPNLNPCSWEPLLLVFSPCVSYHSFVMFLL